MTAVPTKTGGRVCVSGFGSVSHRGKKTENIAQSHGREAPSLELIRETWIGERNGVGESISRKLRGEESSYARIRLHYKEVREWLSFHGGILFTSGVSVKTTGMFWNVFSGFAACVYSLAAATLLQPVITLFLSLCQQNYTPFNGVLLTSPDDCYFVFLWFTFFWATNCYNQKPWLPKFKFLFILVPPQVLTVRVQGKEGRARSLGRRDPVLAAHAAGMKRKINPSFPNSQTIPELEQNSNHQRLRKSVRQWKNP